MVRLGRGRPTWAVPVLLFLAVVLVAALAFNLANLDTGGEVNPVGAGTSTPPDSVGQFGSLLGDILLLAFVAVCIVGAVYAFLRRRERVTRPAKPLSWWEVVSSVIGFALIMVLLLAWPRFLRIIRPAAVGTNADNGSGANATAWPAAAGAPLSLFLLVTVFATFVAIAFILRRGVMPNEMDRRASEGVRSRDAAVDAVQSAIDELELGGDVRSVILACYRRFCALLGARGIRAQVSLTPRELERLAVERLQVSHEASETLTSLFEEARYSVHPLGDADRSRAIESLAGIRAALEA